jgi:hypothetical protein
MNIDPSDHRYRFRDSWCCLLRLLGSPNLLVMFVWEWMVFPKDLMVDK